VWCIVGGLTAAALFPVVREPYLALFHGAKQDESTYGHVFALLFDKLRFLGRKPADPSALSPDARSLWIEDFTSPSVYLAIMLFGVPGIAAVVAGWRARRVLRPSSALVTLLVLLSLSALSFLLVKRLFVLTAGEDRSAPSTRETM
jgi:hypothetical protein